MQLQSRFFSVGLVASLVCSLFAGLPSSYAAPNDGFSFFPSKFEATLAPGASVKKTVTLKNTSQREAQFNYMVRDFTAKDNQGTVQYVQMDPELSFSNWVEVDTGSLVIAPGDKKDVPITITAPQNAEPGGHFGNVLFYIEPEDGGQISSILTSGPLFFVTVQGDTTKEASLSDFRIGEASMEQIVFETEIENTGNVHIKPVGKIELFNEEGNLIKEVDTQNIRNSQGMVVKTKPLDYLLFNEDVFITLPGQTRMYKTVWRSAGYDDSITAKLTLSYGDEVVTRQLSSDLSTELDIISQDVEDMGTTLVYRAQVKNTGLRKTKLVLESKAQGLFNTLGEAQTEKLIASNTQEVIKLEIPKKGVALSELSVNNRFMYGNLKNKHTSVEVYNYTLRAALLLIGLIAIVILAIFMMRLKKRA